jgi:flagellin
MPVISTNLAANSAVRYLNMNSAEQTASLSKLASGSRITQASDDAAGLAISTKISSDVTALTQAATNASHGVSVLQTADGGASNISDILQRMKSLASQSSSGTVTDTERAYIEAEFSQLIEEVDGIATGTRYNGQSLLDGSSAFANGISVMVGSSASDTVEVTISTLTALSLGLSTSDSVEATGTDATTATAGTATGSIDISGGITIGTAETLTITVDGTDYTAAFTTTGDSDGDGSYTQTEVLSTINTALGSNGTATVDGDGNIVVTSATTGDSSAVTMSSTGTALLGTVSTEDGISGAATAATVTGGTGGYTVSGDDVSFDVNGTTVTLSATGGTSGNGVYSVDDLVTAVNDALTADSNTAVTASNVSGALTFTSSTTGASAEVTIDNFDGLEASDLGLTATTDAADLSVSTQDGAIAAITAIDAAIDTVSRARANIGALESRFSFRSESIATSIENLQAANSAITDTDVASESSKLASAKVKTQAAVAAAAQASQMPQDLLKLLQ